MVKSRYLFKIYYIGKKKYYGSQRQHNVLTTEQCILNALRKRNYIDESNHNFEFASRTDRLVSARGACFTCNIENPPILMELNSALSRDIGIWAFAKVPLDFSARHNAVLRHYLYIAPLPLSFNSKANSFNIDEIQEACKYLEGKHDFTNFSKKEKDVNKTTVRDMDYVSFSVHNDFLIFHFKSKGFLRQQIRRLVTKLLELGKGEINYEDFLTLFDISKTFSYKPADPSGLILWDIIYNSTIEFKEDEKSKERMNDYFGKKKLYSGLQYQLFSVLHGDNFS